jgi:3-hydroxybutyryl-CoA dehydrogenase
MRVKGFGVIGAGSMGNGIAQVSAQAGFPTVLFDIGTAQLDRAKTTIQKSLQKLEEKGKLKGNRRRHIWPHRLTTSLTRSKDLRFRRRSGVGKSRGEV